MTALSTIHCPRCDATLVSVESGVDGWCARCGAVLPTPSAGPELATSRKAIFSLVFGGLSLFGFIAAIPAIAFGVLALRDIGKRPTELRGRMAAYIGIAAGLFLGLFFVPFVATMTVQVVGLVQARMRSNEHEVVMGIADEIGVVPPDGLTPHEGARNPMFRERNVTFLEKDEDDDKPAKSLLYVFERRDDALPETVVATAKGHLKRFKQPLPEGRRLELRTLAVDDARILVQFAKRRGGDYMQEVRFCQFAAGKAQLAVYWRVREPDDVGAEKRAQQFKELLQSLVTKAIETDNATDESSSHRDTE